MAEASSVRLPPIAQLLGILERVHMDGVLLLKNLPGTSQVTYVTLVPRGNETLRRRAILPASLLELCFILAPAAHHVLLSILVMTSPDVWPSILTDYTYDSELDNADGVPHSVSTQRLVPSGNQGYIRNLGRF